MRGTRAGPGATDITRVLHDVELAVGVVRQAIHGAIVLCHVKVNGPWPQDVGNCLQRGIHRRAIGPIVTFRRHPVFRGVVGRGEQHGVGHVRLESEHFWTADGFEQLGS